MTEDKSSFPICPHGQILIPVPTVTVHEGADDYSRNAARWCRLTPEETTDPLTSYRVDHAITLGFSWKQIDALRPPAVIEGFARFDLDRYAFQCVSETEVETTRAGAKQSRIAERLVALWKAKPLDAPVTVSDAVEKWGIARQNANAQLAALVEEGMLRRALGTKGRSYQWQLEWAGVRLLRETLNLHPSCGMDAPSTESLL